MKGRHEMSDIEKQIMLESHALTIQTVIQQEIARELVNAPQVAVFPLLADKLGLRITALLAAQQLAKIKYPCNWWEAVKERWLPRWAKACFPVQYTIYDLKAIYPKVALPEQEHYVVAIRGRDL